MATYVGGGGGDAVAREGLEIPTHDYVSNTYTGNNATQTVFKRGGADGVVVATLTRTFDGSNNLLTVTRS
jgi:hypothetical protein